ncbi:MAG: Na+/H+ antiporter subunit E [Alphaproteobacteria bacterium]|nr:Na+/H+ antiporter subunit E [Alphaproteobacteria bacterium]
MSFLLVAATFALIWTAITGNFSLSNLLFGAALGLLALWIIRARTTGPKLLPRYIKAASLAGLFFWELGLSALRVTWLIVTPDLKKALQPGIIAFPLSVKSDEEITLLANLITLTPGTLSVDVSQDRKILYVHAIAVPDKEALIAEIAAGFERKIIEVFE